MTLIVSLTIYVIIRYIQIGGPIDLGGPTVPYGSLEGN